MIFCHIIGRIGKDAEIVTSQHGNFMKMSVATDDYIKGQNKTTWVQVKSGQEQLINAAQYFTKGKLVIVEGTLAEPSTWTDKEGQIHSQHTVNAVLIRFYNLGSKKETKENNNTGAPDNTPTQAIEPFGPSYEVENAPF